MSSDTNAAQQESERQKTLDSMERWLFSESEEYWDIPHALFWAATRDRKGMARYFAPGPGKAFQDAFRGDELASLTVWLKDNYPHPLLADIASIEDAARHGRIEIEGKEDGRFPWRPIPAGDWGGGLYKGGLALFESDYKDGIYAADPFPHQKVWTHLRVKREAMTGAFSAGEGHDQPSQPVADVATLSAPLVRKAEKYVSAADYYRQNEADILKALRDAKKPLGQGAVRREAARLWNQMEGNENRQVKADGS